MKNVLIPTDLTVQSLSPVHAVVIDGKDEKVVIHVVHMLSLPSSITDLLFIQENKPHNKIPLNFVEGLQLLRNKYEKRVEKINFDFVYCSNSRYLNNFLEGNHIDAVYMLDNYNYKQPLPQSQKFTSYIEKCRVSLIKLPVRPEMLSEYQILSSLLTSHDKPTVNSAMLTNPTTSYS